jgi:hypothetical protein
MDDFIFVAFSVTVFLVFRAAQVGWDRRNSPARDETNRLRAAAIIERIAQTGQPFDAPSWTPAPAALCVTLIAVLSLGLLRKQGALNWGTVLLLIALLVWAAVLWRRLAQNLRAPFLRLSREGLSSIDYGFVPWSAIEGVHLAHYKAGVAGMDWRALELHVPTLAELTGGMSARHRLAYRFRIGTRRRIVRIDVTLARESGVVIAKVAEYLLTARSGRRNEWPFERGWGESLRPRTVPRPRSPTRP